MKKKLLSVLMAGALVATSSVNAFATEYTSSEEGTIEAPVTITGNVTDTNGDTKPGTLSVTVPTAASFTVNQTGGFTGADIQIENNGTQKIDVFAYEFIDVNKGEGINVIKSSELATNNRSSVALNLKGNLGVAYFKTETSAEKKGVYSDVTLTTEGDATGVKIADIAQGSSYTLKLEGEAGQNQEAVNEAKQDTFTLKLKIKKASNK